MFRHSTLLPLPLLLIFFGCESSTQSPTAPSTRMSRPTSESQMLAPGAAGQFPLVLGATWTYEGTEQTRDRPTGQADYGPTKTRRFTRVAHAAQRTQVDFPGVEYLVIESELNYEGGPGPFMFREYLRQDRTALYSADLGGISSFVLASPGTPVKQTRETIILLYPVRVGLVWKGAPNLMSNPTFTVEAIEPMRTPIGVESSARVAANTELLDARQPDLTWFGRSGILQAQKRWVSKIYLPTGGTGEREYTIEERLVAVGGL